MKKRKNIDLVKLISIIITLSGLLVMIDWIFNIGIQQSIITQHITMKLPTALSFLLAGLSLYIINENKKRSYISITLLPLLASFLLFIMISFLISGLFGINTPLSQALFIEHANPPDTPYPGSPAIVTVFNFVLIAVANMIIVFDTAKIDRKLFILGSIILATGLVAIFGYIFDMPLLYYKFQEFTNPIAFPTAVLFSLNGIALMKLSKS